MVETILQFPNRCVGVICRLDSANGQLERLALAEGMVAVPVNALLHVVALQAECLEPVLPVALQVDGLQINKTTITGDELAPVARFVKLRYLNASKARKIDDAGIRHFAGLSRLEHLDLYATLVTDAGLFNLANLESLEHLHLGGTRLRGSGLGALRGLRRLAWLSVEHMPVGDAAVAQIDCPGLSKLVVFGTRVTPDGVRAFRRRFPSWEIVVDREIEKIPQRAARARQLLTLLVRRVVAGHPLKAEDDDEAVVEVVSRLFPAGTQFEGLMPRQGAFKADVREGRLGPRRALGLLARCHARPLAPRWPGPHFVSGRQSRRGAVARSARRRSPPARAQAPRKLTERSHASRAPTSTRRARLPLRPAQHFLAERFEVFRQVG